METDILYIIHWWLLLFLFGICFLPITLKIFSTFFDKGYLFSKLIGLAFVSYLVFLFGTLHITPFTQTTIIAVLIIATITNGVFFLKKDLLQIFKKKKVFFIFLFEEVLFFFSLKLWAYIRGFTPDIHELEKFMDFGFVNSILRSTYFPPKDMWFTPFPINYYYFGHFVTAVLTKLSGISSNITFNLMLATIFAFCFTCGFSLGANLWYLYKKEQEKTLPKKQGLVVLFTGMLSAVLLTFGGNLHIIYAFFKSYGNDNPVPLWQLPFLPGSFPNNYWYPNATRFIYHTIHEFPMYSFVVSDLHGHVLDIPFVLLTIAVLLAFFSNFHLKKIVTTKYLQLNTIFIGFLLAIMYMTNAWDGLMYFLLSVIILAVIIKQTKQVYFFDNVFIEGFSLTAIIIAAAYIFSRPFAIFFNVGEIAHGIGILCAPKFLTDKQQIGPFLFEANHCQHSPWWQLLTLYGFFYIWAIPFIIFLWKKWRKNTYSPLRIAAHHSKEHIATIKEKTYTIATTDIFILVLILFATFLIIIPEFFYLKDIYPDHYRANTMFKLVYQAFMMLSVASGYIIVRFFLILKSQRQILKKIIGTTAFSLFAIILIILVAGLYPYFAISSYYGNLQTYHSLDGTAYLKTLYPTDYEAILWLNKHISGQPVILEAQGDSYTDYARISANTGLPTVLGWTVHEWLWRGTYDVPAPRITDVQTLYETTDIPTAKTLIKKYNIQYVFIGYMERKKYLHLQIDKFNKLGKIIYKNGSTMIYQITI